MALGKNTASLVNAFYFVTLLVSNALRSCGGTPITVSLEVTENVEAATATTAELEAVSDDNTKNFQIVSSVSVAPSDNGARFVLKDPGTPTVDGTTFTLRGTMLTPGTQYTVTVSIGDGSAGINKGVVTPGTLVQTICTLPVAPSTLAIDDTVAGPDLKVTWTAPTPAADVVKISLEGTETTLSDPTATEYTFTGLVVGSSHDVIVTSYAAAPCDTSAATPTQSLVVLHGIEMEETAVTDQSITFDVFVDSAKDKNFKIMQAPTYGPSSTAATLTPTQGATEHTFFSVSVTSGLTASTKYTFTIHGIDTGTETSTGIITTKVFDFCTKSILPTNLAVDTAGTTSTQVKITWTKPTTDAPILKVAFGDSVEKQLTDVQLEEYIFENLDANQSGPCKVIVAGTGESSDCTDQVEVQCATKSATSVLLPKITILFLLFPLTVFQ